MGIEQVEIGVYPANERVRFVVYRIDPLPDEYHVHKEARAYDGERWFGAVYQCEQSEEVARMVAQSCAASYGRLHPRGRS